MSKEIKPVNYSGRSKEQIVAEAEATWLYSHLVVKPECDENCRCMTCFHKRLDAAVSMGAVS